MSPILPLAWINYFFHLLPVGTLFRHLVQATVLRSPCLSHLENLLLRSIASLAYLPDFFVTAKIKMLVSEWAQVH